MMLLEENLQDTVRKSNKVLRATGNHSYLTITLRVTLVRDFVKSLLTLSIYILSLKDIFIQNRLSGAFQTRLFLYKRFDKLYM